MAETRQVHVVLDLASLVGTMQYVEGRRLPRSKQAEPKLERYFANVLLSAVGQNEHVSVGEVRCNRPDPPDVSADYGGQHIGIEVTEMMPSYRLEKDAIIRQLRRDVLAKVKVGPHTRDLAFNVYCHEDYAKRFRPGRWVGPLLGKTLAEFIAGPVSDRGTIAVPSRLQTVVSTISYFRDENVPKNPLIVHKDEPLIIFGAQNTRIDPVADFPEMVAERLGRKCGHKLDRSTWLLLWSEHHAMEGFQTEVVTALQSYFATYPSPYQRTFYLHCGSTRACEIRAGKPGT